MRKMKRGLSLLIAILLILSLYPEVSFAADGSISSGGTYDLSTYGDGSTITVSSTDAVTFTNTAGTVYTDVRIVCAVSGVNLTLSGVNVSDSTSGYCALSFTGSSNKLTLFGENTLASGSGSAGIGVPEGVELTITEDSSGSLNAVGGFGGAGIGGGKGADGSGNYSGSAGVAGGTITIEGGTITATGNGGAGIGGGAGGYGTSISAFVSGIKGNTGGSGGAITITGGTVTATGNNGGAGIGGGAGGNGKEYTNNSEGNSISGGAGGGGGTVTINGGTVTASGSGAGIGGGAGGASSAGYPFLPHGGNSKNSGGNSGTITITGGIVTASGGSRSAGIGGGGGGSSASTMERYCYGGSGGSGGSGEQITISGGVVNTTGGAAGIGGGSGNNGSYSYYYIGGSGGSGGSGGLVTITGGYVTASGSTADIGKGNGGNGGDAYDGGVYGSTRGSDGSNGSDASLYIVGGSVDADVSYSVYQSSARTTQIYKTAVMGLPTSGSVTCSYNGGDPFASRTTANGYLYLWLPAGSNTALAVSGSDIYAASGTTETTQASVMTSNQLALPKGEVGVSYSETLTDSGSGYSWTWTAATGSKLPPGLSLSSDGEISGTPKTGGEYSVVLTASYGAYTDSVTLNLKIYSSLASGLSDLSVTGFTLNPEINAELTKYSLGSVASSVSSVTITATLVDASSVLTINGENATNGGATDVMLSTGSNAIDVTVTSADGLSQKTYVITVIRRAAPTIETDGTTVAIAGQPYSKTLSASGGATSYKWSISGLPSGLALDADTGVISGTASTAGSYSLAITVTDSNGETAQKSLTLKVMKGNGNGAYLITPDSDACYTAGMTDDGLPTMTVDSGIKGFTYFTVNIEVVAGHSGMETAVFVQIRDGQQINFSFSRADLDTAGVAVAGFNVKPGDIIEVYVVDDVANTGSPIVL